MKKRYLTIGGIVILLFVAIYVIGGMVISKVAVVGVEAFVPQVTKTSVDLKGLRVSPISGSGTLHGFVLGNPEGYASDYSIAFESAHMNVSPLSLLSDRILIQKINVSGPKFNYERKIISSNIKEILKNVQAASGRPVEGEETADEAPPSEVKIEIRELIIEEGQVSLSMAGATVPIPVPRIVLKDIGTSKGGIAPDEMAFEVMSVVLNQVLVAVAKSPAASVEGTVEGIKNLFGGKEGN